MVMMLVSKVLVMAMSMVAMTPVMATDRHQMAVGGLMISKTARCGERRYQIVQVYSFILSVYSYQVLSY